VVAEVQTWVPRSVTCCTAAASLGVQEDATRYTDTCLFIAMREVIKTRPDQGTTHVSWGFRQNDRKKNKFQLQAQSG